MAGLDIAAALLAAVCFFAILVRRSLWKEIWRVAGAVVMLLLLPVAVGFLDKEEIPGFMQGVLWGVLALPFGLAAGGLVLGLGPWVLLRNLAPVAGLCALLAVMLFLAPEFTRPVFHGVRGRCPRAGHPAFRGGGGIGLF